MRRTFIAGAWISSPHGPAWIPAAPQQMWGTPLPVAAQPFDVSSWNQQATHTLQNQQHAAQLHSGFAHQGAAGQGSGGSLEVWQEGGPQWEQRSLDRLSPGRTPPRVQQMWRSGSRL